MYDIIMNYNVLIKFRKYILSYHHHQNDVRHFKYSLQTHRHNHTRKCNYASFVQFTLYSL